MVALPSDLITSGVIADRLGIPPNKAAYLLRSLNIRPVGRAGICRVFDPSAVDRVRKAIEGSARRQHSTKPADVAGV